MIKNLLLVFALQLVALPIQAQAVALPSGFAQSSVAEGLNPTCMAYAPDGRVFLAQKDGRVLILHENGDLHPEPFITLPVDAFNEKGLNGIALDPHFDTQPWVYLYYTVPGVQHNRVSRVWANGDFAVPGSEQVLIDLDPLSGSIHNAGALVFGPDERLYIGVGDGASSNNGQNLNTVLGKILRINADGSIPPDNPFFNQSAGKNRAIYAYGVRNPFSMACDPVTEKIYFCDVGAEAWEEVNELAPGANYGWKLYQGASGNPAFKDPVFAYNHNDGCAVVGAAFAFQNNALIPAEYRGKFFFADYCKGWIKILDPATGNFAGTFATGIDRPVSLLATPDGEMYYLARAGLGGGSETDNTASQEGTIWRVFWVGTGAPLVTGQPQSVLVAEGESAVFRTQAFGGQPIHYQWYLNGEVVPGADSAVWVLNNLSLADSGSTVFCVAENAFGADASQTAVVGVSSNHRPQPEILFPLSGDLYRGGDTLLFSGQAIDPEEGILPAGRLTWRIDFHHATHTHPGLPATPGVAQGQYVVSHVGETSTDVFFRIYLTARDTLGFEKTTTRDVFPAKTGVTIDGPAGIAMNVDGQIRPLPAVFESVVGITRTIQAPEIQRIGDTVYLFDHWSGGSTDPLVSFITPDSPVALEAIYNSYTLGNGEGLAGQYFIDPQGDFDEPPVLMRIDTTVNYNWGDGSPDPLLPIDYFTARWRGFVQPLFSETYNFHVFSDDGCKLWIGDSLVIDKWEPQAPKENSGSLVLEAGKKYPVRLEFLEIGGGALVQLSWSSAHQVKQIVPRRQLYLPSIPFPAGIYGNLGLDTNNNGIWENGEPTLAGATVRLYDAGSDTLVALTLSTTNGRYSFPELPQGSYYQKITLSPTADVLVPVQNVDASGITPVFDLAPASKKYSMLHGQQPLSP
ncbi:MAG: PQQ-dependent sugar dehydrogenase [Lewinellaceae bacterium]|nr:PQQ-dependent sugar dehydrogenase [Lewinellaceae bacterium]